jgi:hypothetical protein
MRELLGRKVELPEVFPALQQAFETVFSRQITVV